MALRAGRFGRVAQMPAPRQPSARLLPPPTRRPRPTSHAATVRDQWDVPYRVPIFLMRERSAGGPFGRGDARVAPVLLVRDLLQPINAVAVECLRDRDVAHRRGWFGAIPMPGT